MVEVLMEIASISFWFTLATSGLIIAIIEVFFTSVLIIGFAGVVVSWVKKKRRNI